MDVKEWSRASVGYGRKLMESAVEGARTGESEFVKEEPLVPYFTESARQALVPAAIGAFLGAVGGYLGSGQRSAPKALAGGIVGGAIGFGVGMIWESRKFTASVASSTWKSISKTRDERWLERNPIDYA